MASHTIETPEEVADTLRNALRFVDADKLIPSTNCGLAPLSRDLARGKLRALSAGGCSASRGAHPPPGPDLPGSDLDGCTSIPDRDPAPTRDAARGGAYSQTMGALEYNSSRPPIEVDDATLAHPEDRDRHSSAVTRAS